MRDASRLEPTADRAVFGAFEADQLIGMAGLGRAQMGKISHKAYVWGIYVEPENRGKGLGRRLLEAAFDFAAQVPGTTQVCTSVYSGNNVARSLYVSAGLCPTEPKLRQCKLTVGSSMRSTWFESYPPEIIYDGPVADRPRPAVLLAPPVSRQADVAALDICR